MSTLRCDALQAQLLEPDNDVHEQDRASYMDAAAWQQRTKVVLSRDMPSRTSAASLTLSAQCRKTSATTALSSDGNSSWRLAVIVLRVPQARMISFEAVRSYSLIRTGTGARRHTGCLSYLPVTCIAAIQGRSGAARCASVAMQAALWE